MCAAGNMFVKYCLKHFKKFQIFPKCLVGTWFIEAVKTFDQHKGMSSRMLCELIETQDKSEMKEVYAIVRENVEG